MITVSLHPNPHPLYHRRICPLGLLVGGVEALLLPNGTNQNNASNQSINQSISAQKPLCAAFSPLTPDTQLPLPARFIRAAYIKLMSLVRFLPPNIGPFSRLSYNSFANTATYFPDYFPLSRCQPHTSPVPSHARQVQPFRPRPVVARFDGAEGLQEADCCIRCFCEGELLCLTSTH